MPNFKYKVRDRRGRSISGMMEGDSAQGVSDALAKQGYFPISIAEGRLKPPVTAPVFFASRVKQEDLSIFVRQLATMQRAGVPLLAGLAALKDQAATPAFKKVVARIIKDLEGGSSLSTAFSQQPKVFKPLYVHMVRAGEASGKLDEVLHNLSEMGQFEKMTRDRIKSATLYPSITVVTLFLVFLGVVHFVVPRFADFYKQYKAALPLPTRLLLALNNMIQYHWAEALLAVGAAIVLFRVYTSRPLGRYQWDWLRLKVPVFGKLLFMIQMSRFTRVLSDLLKSGVPILESLQLVSDTVENRVIEKAVFKVKKEVNEGKSMALTMKNTGFFSPIVVQMMEVGEKSGKTDELLSFVSAYYEDIASSMIKNLTTLIEPMLIFIIGGMVLVLATGVFLPVWNLVNVVKY